VTARITPYELVLEPLEITAFPAIRAEAQERGRDTRRRDQFVLLGHVGATLKEIVPDDAPPDSLEEFAELLYHGFQFWSFGRRLYTFDPEVMDLLTGPHVNLEDWRLGGCPSCYLQLPAQRIWARVSVDAPYEPADGIFVVLDDTEPAPETGVHLRAQLVLGLRSDRAGLSLVSYRTDLDPRSAPMLADHPWRENDAPFASLIPGDDRRAHRTLATTSELQALVIRALHHIDRNTDRLIAESGSAEEGESKLPHLRVAGSG
jgi:hypothetical protein